MLQLCKHLFIKVTYTKNGQCLLYEHCDLGLKNASSPFGVIQVADTGMALLHNTSCSGGLRQIHVTISNLAIPKSVNLLSK